jgi:hypothetical protein
MRVTVFWTVLLVARRLCGEAAVACAAGLRFV